MKPFLTFYLLVALPLLLHSQNNIAVKSFTLLERDMSARIDHPKIDQNGEKAALIKVVTTQTGFEFDGGSLGIVAVVQKTAEVWVYVPRGAKAITIKHPKLGVLRSYPFPIPIVAATVYEMVLVTGTVETVVREAEIETQWLIINTEPVGADVYINDQPAGKTPYQNELPIGKYTWRVSKEMYTTDAGVAELTSALGKSKIDLKLKPNFGKLSITSIPESGATVTLNGMPTGKTTPCVLEPLAAGEHTIGIALEWYETTTRNVTLAVGQTLPLTVEMNPTFVEIAIKTDSIADIYINNQLKSKGTWKGRLNPGVYTFEAKLEGHIPATQKQTVAKGIPVSLFLKPTPKTGTLKVVSNPFDASISLNGKEYGMTPNTIKNLLVGIYTLNIKKKGYGTIVKTVTINENTTTEVNETLPTGKEITIASTPDGAKLMVDGVSAGITPYTTTLSFGNHSVKLVNGKKVVEESILVNQGDITRFEFNMVEISNYTENAFNLNLEMIPVQGGTFAMESKNGETVTVGDFFIGKFEVTQAQWRAVMGSNPSNFNGCDKCPVERVNFNDVQYFINKLNENSDKTYRLPTEAEWEYAAHGGVSTKGYKYSGSNSIDEVSWYIGNSKKKTHPVGSKKPNELGIYDMSGNVEEWVSDMYGGRSRNMASWRACRGGSYALLGTYSRVASRNGLNPSIGPSYIGFRLVSSSK
jgi:formylglycine-generating enzyme required for sulfatase activity